MACTYTYQGKTYSASEFDDVLRAMSPSVASKYIPGVSYVPDAPMVADTKAWVALGIKRAIRHAVDVGADGIVFGTGEQNANLYDLSKQVDRLDIEPYGVEAGVQQYRVTAMKDGAKAIDRTVSEPELSNVVGKDIAKEAISGKTRFEGEGLRVGGEGMREFYDRIVPQVANEVLKKIGANVKVAPVGMEDYAGMNKAGDRYKVIGLGGEQYFDTKEEAKAEYERRNAEGYPQPGFHLTDAMKATVRQGMPLFAKAPRQAPLPGVAGTVPQPVSPTLGGSRTTPEQQARVVELFAKQRKTSLIDRSFRAVSNGLQVTRVTVFAGNLAGRLINKLTPEMVKAGVVSDYGLPGVVIDRRDQMRGHMLRQLRGVQRTLEAIGMLTRGESRVAYEWMNNRDADDLLNQLPEESRAILVDLKAHITNMGVEAVRLGQLDAETFERHAMAYLHRSYQKHDLEDTPQNRQKRAQAIKILGDQYKGRGMVDPVAMDKIKNVSPEWWKRKTETGLADKGLKGEKFIRFERRKNRGEGVYTLDGVEESAQPGKLLEVNYWPADEAVPAKYLDWHREEVWEVRGTKGGKLLMWRDFTKPERVKMGEIDEVRYAIAKTMHNMIHDIEVGKYLEWLASHYAKPEHDLPRDADTKKKASTSMAQAYKPDEWVLVPDTKVRGTDVYQYGKLAGLYIPGPIWNDVRHVTGGFAFDSDMGRAYATVLKAWKVSKTALSPAVHMNNIMANFVMADWHDVTAGHLRNALQVFARATHNKERGMVSTPVNWARDLVGGNINDAVADEILARFEDASGTQGTYIMSEVQREHLAPLLDQLREEVGLADRNVGMLGVLGAWEAVKAKRWSDIWPALNGSAAANLTADAVRKAMDIYQGEDVVFRMAAFIKAKSEGKDDAEAGKSARESFLDYNINAPWIQAARQTALPFISFSYRAIPKLIDTMQHKPWKLMKLAAFGYALNALGYMMAGGDEDDERRYLPEEKAGSIWGIVPKLVRMPWNNANEDPVFLDVRRFIPVGDILDTGMNHTAMPLPPSLVPGGPLALLAELYSNRSQFTGKEITDEVDMPMDHVDNALKVMSHVYKSFAPNIIVLPGTYAFNNVINAGPGRTDQFHRELSMPMAIASGFGIKLAAYPTDSAQYYAHLKLEGRLKKIGAKRYDLDREYNKGAINAEEYRARAMELADRQQYVVQKFNEK